MRLKIAQIRRGIDYGSVIVAVLLCALHNALLYAAEPVGGLAGIESIVMRGIEDGQMPGAVVAVGNSSQVLYLEAFGERQVEPTREAMSVDTIFDLASLTKPIVTATSVMLLYERGKIDLQKPVVDYLPEFASNGKQTITVADLLLHVGGMIPDNPLDDYQHSGDLAWRRLMALQPQSKPGQNFAYSDVGFIILGKLVERVSGKSLDRFANDDIFQPLQMRSTAFNPPQTWHVRTAPTESKDGMPICGTVHDPRALLLGGVAGHAGLFSTAEDLIRYGQMCLSVSDSVVLKRDTIELMSAPHAIKRAGRKIGTRTLGWDHRSPFSSNRGHSFSDQAYGHGGFTGTVMWIDPVKNLVFVFLSSRLHPDGKGSVNSLAGEIATAAGEHFALPTNSKSR